VWNGSAFEAPVSGNWATYDIAMTEQATSTGIFRASMPAAAAGLYCFVVRKQGAGAPAVTDIVLGSSHLFAWDGSAVLSVTSADQDTIATALLDLANGVESGKTLRQTLRIMAAIIGGKISGAGTGTETFRGLDDSADRAVVTVDQNGNRTAVSY